VEWVFANWSFVSGLAFTHLGVSLGPIIVGSLLAVLLARIVPLGFTAVAQGLLSAGYAIPSLALFVTLPIILGTNYIGPTNVIVALTIYVVASMFFSAQDAFREVPRPTITTATALGMSPWQMFLHVEIPMAIPGLIAGLRVASASTISIASIGAVVGVRNLGYLFIDGFQRKIPEEIVTGIVSIFLIALTLDVGLWLVGRMLTPWRRLRVSRA
jgi:osmoprotectant transport system permease protein